MPGYKFMGIMMILTLFHTLCTGTVTRKDGPKTSETMLGSGSIKVLGSDGKETVLDGPNGSIKVLGGPKGKVTLLNGSSASGKVRRAVNGSVIERLGPKLTVQKPIILSKSGVVAHNASGKVRREANSSMTLHRVLLTKEREIRDTETLLNVLHGQIASNGTNRNLKPVHSAVNASTPVTATTPKVGNMITVPDNCPAGKKFVDGECREIWEPSR